MIIADYIGIKIFKIRTNYIYFIILYYIIYAFLLDTPLMQPRPPVGHSAHATPPSECLRYCFGDDQENLIFGPIKIHFMQQSYFMQ